MKNLLLIIREPFIDRIPSLKTFIWFLLQNNINITVITSKSDKFPLISISHKNLTIKYVKERSKIIETPTFLKLIFKTYLNLINSKIDYILGGDAYGNIIASNIAHLFHIPYINFILEYPQIITSKFSKLTKWQICENKAIENANIIITHDIWHKRFLLKNFSLNPKQIYLLPNASLTPIYNIKSNYLHQKFNLEQRKVIILHSGGFGKWFQCKELAQITQLWDNDWVLVFHISHKITGNSYFNDVCNECQNKNIIYSLDPVDTYTLDKLIASADIGVALYDENELNYRATLMGLASGKIGNYLKCGLPVICNRYESLKYIEEYQCGVLVDSESDIPDAIRNILKNKNEYRKNAYKCYQELWQPDPYLEKIKIGMKI